MGQCGVKLRKLRTALKALTENLGYRVQRMRPRQLFDPNIIRRLQFDDVICRRMIESGPELSFIQVGAFDGISNDPLYKYISRFNWRGVLVEPQPFYAEKLRALYGEQCDRLTIIEAAVGGAVGQRAFYTVAGEGPPAWAMQLASFERTTITSHARLIPGLEQRIRETMVPCTTFDAILDDLPGSLDLLQIDAEGADAYLLSLFPFERIKPAIVHFEFQHLSMEQKESCLDQLVRYGYRVGPSEDVDMLATVA